MATAETIAVKVVRKSPFSGVENTIWVTATQAQLDAVKAGEVAQVAFPHLSADDREFILTGITPAEWAATFPEGE